MILIHLYAAFLAIDNSNRVHKEVNFISYFESLILFLKKSNNSTMTIYYYW